MITYEMIESKIDRLIEQGFLIMEHIDEPCYRIDAIRVYEYSIYINEICISERIKHKSNYKNLNLYFKLEKLYNEQKRTKITNIIKYLES